MPYSTLDDVIASFQLSILREERKTASAMVRVYADGWKRVKAKMATLQAQYDKAVASGEAVDSNWIYQNSRLIDIQTLIGKELRRFSTYAGSSISSAQRRAIAESLTFSRDSIILRLGPEYDVSDFLRVTSLPTKSIEIMVGVNQPGSPLQTLFQGINTDGAREASNALIEGMMLGYNPRKVAPMIRDALGVQLTRALTVSRTEIMRAHRIAAEENYKANSDIVTKWRWQAELSGACGVCVAMHGTEHPIGEKMSSHPNCRCVEVPITLSWEELGEKFGIDFTGVDKSGPTFEELAKKYNMSPAQIARYQNSKITGESYFNQLNESEQRRLLGPAKWQAWKDGKFTFDKLVKSTWNSTWGEGKSMKNLIELLGEEGAQYYLDLIRNKEESP
jgi:SPP1 gp7 family putative phage head morphogenesis protein